jgi:hypothetical protein
VVVVDPEPVSGHPSELQVTVTTTVTNTFGTLLGSPKTTIRRTAIANYQAPLAMGSPCNEFGNGPETSTTAINQRSSNCNAAGQFWANVGSPKAYKTYGDAYQDNNCGNGGDNCSGSNSDYSNSGYFYTVKVTQAVTNLTFQAFDPAFVSVDDKCGTNFGSGATAAVNAKNSYNYDPSTKWSKASPLPQDTQLYASGNASPYCTGDQLYANAGSTPPDTTYTIRQPVSSSNPWDPSSYPAVGGCSPTFKGFSGDLYSALNQWTQNASSQITYSGTSPVAAASYNPTVAGEFRQWVTLCTIPGTISPGTYFVQVQTNGPLDTANGEGHNRFALRAYGSGSNDNANIAISGYTNMAIYANVASAVTTFYLAQVPPGAAGQILDVRLFDIGDAPNTGTVTIVPPADSGLSTFTGCTGVGPSAGSLSNCAITSSSAYNGKWETISVPIPATYTCNFAATTGCWITLRYNYGSGNTPSDTTSWQASLEGTPVRITQ